MNNIRALISAVINAATTRLRPMQLPTMLPQFAGQHTNAVKNERRKVMRVFGKRQFKKRKLHKHFPREN